MTDLLRQEAEQRIVVDCSTDKIDHIVEANKFVAPYLNGWIDAKEMWAKLYHLKAIIEEAEKQVKDRIVDDIASLYGKECTQIAGLEIRVKKGAGRWSYPSNSVMDELQKNIKIVQELAKIANKTGQEQLWVETGEMIPPAVYSENKDTIETKVLSGGC